MPMPDTIRFKLTPLSPVHVGTGHTISPESYFQDGNELVRINLSALMRQLSNDDRQKVEIALDRNDLKYARSIIQARARNPRYHQFRLPVGRSSRSDLDNLFRDPERPRSGEVHVLPRNPYSGEPFLPGSSIKGAIRTALINHAIHRTDDARRERIFNEVEGTFEDDRPTKRSGERLEELAFERRTSDTEKDPLRALMVSDVSFNKSATRIDRVFVQYGSGEDQDATGIQMHYERLRCKADGDPIPSGTLEINLKQDVISRCGLWRMLPKGAEPWAYLSVACNEFYYHRFEAELRAFPRLTSYSTGPDHWYPQTMQNVILLRLGRFSHFDCLSVDELRRGWNAQKRDVIYEIGSTRTLCELADGVRKAPMGWVLLSPIL